MDRSELHANEQRLRMALDAAQLTAWEWDLAAGTVTYSAHETTYFRLPPGLLTRSIDVVDASVYPPDYPAYQRAVAAAIACGAPYQLQVRVRAHDGKLRWLDVRGVVRRDDAGRPTHIVGVSRDISTEKRREATRALHLAVSQALYPDLDVGTTLTAIARLPLPDLADVCAIALVDDGLLRPAVALHGGSGRAVGPGELPSPRSLAGAPILLGEALRAASPLLLAAVPPELSTALGLPALRSALLLPFAAQGRALGVIMLGLTTCERQYDADDLTLAAALARRGAEALVHARLRAAARAAEKAALEAHARLDALVSSAPGGIGYLDSELRYVLVNPALAAINERPPEGHIGRTVAEMLPALAPELEVLVRKVLETGEAVRDIVLHGKACREDGIAREWLLSYFPVPGVERAVAGVGVTVTDVTASKRTEAALRESRQNLASLIENTDGSIWSVDAQYRLIVGNTLFQRNVGAMLGRDLAPSECLVALPMPQEFLDMWRSLYDRALAGETFSVELETRFALEPRTLEHRFSPIRAGDGAITGVTVFARDITERQRAEEAVRAALAAEHRARLVAEAASERIARLQAVTAGLAGALCREAVIQVIADHGIAATGAISTVVALLDVAGERLEVASWIGSGNEEGTGLRSLPLNAQAPAPAAARTGEPVWISSREGSEADFPSISSVMAQVGAHALATLPLLTPDRMLGTISFSYPAPNPFAPEDRAFLLALAQQCAQALERAELYSAVLESQGRLQHLSQRLIEAQERERRHLARELHDEVGQALTGLRLALEVAGRQPPAEHARRLGEAHRVVQELIARVRALSLDLRPAMLDDMGLLPAVLWQLKRYHEQTGVVVDLRHWGLERRLPPEVETVAYRVVQEALTNIARHAGVDAATVSLLAWPSQLLIQVRDAGRGFALDKALAGANSSGLIGMRERVSLLNGVLSIETAPGAGTCVTADLPLDEGQSP